MTETEKQLLSHLMECLEKLLTICSYHTEPPAPDEKKHPLNNMQFDEAVMKVLDDDTIKKFQNDLYYFSNQLEECSGDTDLTRAQVTAIHIDALKKTISKYYDTALKTLIGDTLEGLIHFNIRNVDNLNWLTTQNLKDGTLNQDALRACETGVFVLIEEERSKVDGSDIKSQIHETKEVPWNDDDPNYITNSEACKLGGEGWNLKKLYKILTPQGLIRYMRKSKRGKVHKADFDKYLKTQARDHFSEQAFEAYEEIKERKAEAKRQKKSRE